MNTDTITLINGKGLARVRAVPVADGQFRIDHFSDRDLRWHEAARVSADRVDDALDQYPYRRVD